MKWLCVERVALTFILLEGIQNDLVDFVADEVKAGFEAHFVETYGEVFDIAFGDVDKAEVSPAQAAAAAA